MDIVNHLFFWVQLNAVKIFAISGLLVISAFASSSETALFSLNRFQLRRIKDLNKSAYSRIKTLLMRPSRLLVLILLLNEVVNIGISSLIAGSVENLTNGDWILSSFISLSITVPLLIFFGEITPKVIAAKMNRVIAVLNTTILIQLYRLFFPILWIADTTISKILSYLKTEGRNHITKSLSVLSEDDFITLMEEGHREGAVNPDERNLIKNVLEFDDSTVSEVMTPIHQIFTVSATSKLEDSLNEIRIQKYSRIPVYQKVKSKIVGILYVKDLLKISGHPDLKKTEIKSLMAAPMLVEPDLRLSVLFRRFKEAKKHIAVCINRNNQAVGIVTMEDLLERIFGEISDERDVQ